MNILLGIERLGNFEGKHKIIPGHVTAVKIMTSDKINSNGIGSCKRLEHLKKFLEHPQKSSNSFECG